MQEDQTLISAMAPCIRTFNTSWHIYRYVFVNLHEDTLHIVSLKSYMNRLSDLSIESKVELNSKLFVMFNCLLTWTCQFKRNTILEEACELACSVPSQWECVVFTFKHYTYQLNCTRIIFWICAYPTEKKGEAISISYRLPPMQEKIEFDN